MPSLVKETLTSRNGEFNGGVNVVKIIEGNL